MHSFSLTGFRVRKFSILPFHQNFFGDSGLFTSFLLHLAPSSFLRTLKLLFLITGRTPSFAFHCFFLLFILILSLGLFRIGLVNNSFRSVWWVSLLLNYLYLIFRIFFFKLLILIQLLKLGVRIDCRHVFHLFVQIKFP